MNTKLYHELSKVQQEINFRIVASQDSDPEIIRLARWFSRYGHVEVDKRKMPIGNRVHEAYDDDIDVILILDGLDHYFGVYSVIHHRERHSLKLEDIMRLVAGG